jgi:hypothetical protein
MRAQSRLRGVPVAWRVPWRRGAISVPEASGYQLGGGVEHALTQNWHLKLEYRYGKYESQTVALLQASTSISSQLSKAFCLARPSTSNFACDFPVQRM